MFCVTIYKKVFIKGKVMIIENGLTFTPGGEFIRQSVQIADGYFSAIGDNIDYTDNEVFDASDLYVIPGLVDIHLHGCMGHDFCDGTFESFDEICNYELSQGVTSISPATMTVSIPALENVFSKVGAYENVTGSRLRGITMEGPFISAKKKGAQNADYIQKPNIELFKKMQRLSNGLIKQVAIAAEEDEDFSFIRGLRDEVVCSLAHSDADYNTAKNAFINGANHVTHLYNAMNESTHRSPGIAAAAFDDKNVYVELITDGIHVDPSVVRMTFKLFGSNRICMISDSMEATGLLDGKYTLGGQTVYVKDKHATLEDGTIAGSVCSLLDCLRIAVKEMNIPLNEAVMSCTLTPAKSIGIDDVCGSIEIGKVSDLVIMDKELNLIRVIR